MHIILFAIGVCIFTIPLNDGHTIYIQLLILNHNVQTLLKECLKRQYHVLFTVDIQQEPM